ncbi:proline--tRNA ligase [Streptomyces xantholiticus]|nr:proline--tRNA ligase [Streptomyces xantholiticus]
MAKAPVLTPRSHDFPRWYQDLINKAEPADNGPVRGTRVIRPYCYGLWERMQQEMDARIKDAGASNACFPLFIPQSYPTREAEHVEGFAPEPAVVTHGGGRELEGPVVVRPTSEVIINDQFSQGVQSYRDLPLLINQWARMVRWEMRPRVFLRTTEFLRQEGHTAHVTSEDARGCAACIHREVCADLMVNVLGTDVVLGRKTPREWFAGAVNTLHPEGTTGDGKALQMGTGHEPGTSFAKAFHTSCLSKDGQKEPVRQSSTDSVCRRGRRPCRWWSWPSRATKPSPVREIGEALKAPRLRVQVDDGVDTPFGRRAVDWEIKDMPVRIEIGPRVLEAGPAMPARRTPGGKEPVSIESLAALLPKILEGDQALLLRQSRVRRESPTSDVTTIEEAADAGGWARIPWATPREEGEAKLAEQAVSCALPRHGGRVGARCGRRARYCRRGGPVAPTAGPPGGGTATSRHGVTCESSPQIGPPDRVRTHQRQLMATDWYVQIIWDGPEWNPTALRLVITT